MNTYTIEPEVAGGLGTGTVMDTTVHPPRVEQLDYEFAGWLGDDLLEAFPCYIVTERLADALTNAELTGFTLADLTVSATEDFSEHFHQPLPRFQWLRVHGRSDVDDMWLHDGHMLTVTETALAALRTAQLANAVIEQAN